jgi:glycosyltransferase involved in cell wall biosynthesis
MRIMMISRSTLLSSPGGDSKQMASTAEYLRKFGCSVDILVESDQVDYSRYDIIHLFNIIRPGDILEHALLSDIPIVVSPIYVDYGMVDRQIRKGLHLFVSRILGADNSEYLKAIYRWIINNERIKSKHYLRLGHSRSIITILKKTQLLLPNSVSEYRRLASKYKINKPYKVINNAINGDYAKQVLAEDINSKAYQKLLHYKGAVVCAGRIEPLKNQLGLISALNKSPYQLYIIGKPSANSAKYYSLCKQTENSNIHFIDHITNELDLLRIFRLAKVHVLPSYFETTGLSSLEAAAMGCNLVITDRGDTVEYFGQEAWYCEPENYASIADAVDAAYHAPDNLAFAERILRDYTWEGAAAATLAAYQQVLSSTSSTK